MFLGPPGETRTYTRFPYTTLFRPRPLRAVEHGVVDARVRLVHAHHPAARGEAAPAGDVAGFLAGFVALLRLVHRGRRGQAADFDVLQLQDPQQPRLRPTALLAGREHVGGGPGRERLLDRAPALDRKSTSLNSSH